MNGYRIMIDSSLEWGSDVPDIDAWARERRTVYKDDLPVFTSVLGAFCYEKQMSFAKDLTFSLGRGQVRSGYFVLSATRLLGGSQSFYGRWDKKMEKTWAKDKPYAWQQRLDYIPAELAVARLAAYCRQMEPMARIGPAYFVFRLDDKDLEAMLSR